MKGILFKPESIKAVTEGRKTVTRRVIIPNFEAKLCKNSDIVRYCNTQHLGAYMFEVWHPVNQKTPLPLMIRPRYRVGEVVYIKEAFYCPERGLPVAYKSNLEPQQAERQVWRSPLFMPEWAARHFIRMLDVRPERLQEIEKDPKEFRREGFASLFPKFDADKLEFTPNSFLLAWESLNAKRGYGWDSNPWVWRYEFQKVTIEAKGEET